MLVALQSGTARSARSQGKGISRETRSHAHAQGQLICIDDGLMRIHTDRGSWVLQPGRAVWMPPHAPHGVSVYGVSTSWNVFISPEAALVLPHEPCVLCVSDLARALMMRAASWTWQEELQPHQERLIAVLLDELRQSDPSAMHLPLPSDRRLLRIANAILESPGVQRTLGEWAAWAGMSARTVNRLFDAEVGMSFSHWRQQAMVIHALERLALGEAVSVVADSLGYASPSNFIAMFRRSFGQSPMRYLSGGAKPG
ncbi:AraC-type DNA-binding protein [Variovorax sp. OV329]|nr:AraC-type DNA-binding protein [Variovorax sp. OV329]